MSAVPTEMVDRIRLTAVFEPGEDGVRELIASYADEAREASRGARYETLEIDLS